MTLCHRKSCENSRVKRTPAQFTQSDKRRACALCVVMLRRVLGGIRSALTSATTSKKLVGSDVKGNKYYAILDDENKWKRTVEFKKGTWDPNEVPQIWRLWLHYQRETPPTKQEELDIEKYQRILHENVKKLEQADEERRKQELESGKSKEQTAYTPEQFFVTWRKQVQQEDGSIDVERHNTGQLKMDTAHIPEKEHACKECWQRSQDARRLSTTEPGRICGRCNAALIHEIHSHCTQCARVFGSCPWCGTMPYVMGP